VNFAIISIEYFGHIISSAGVATDPTKVSAMINWPTPKIVHQLRGFLDLIGYYHKFIKDYGVISRPLIDLFKKYAFLWFSNIQLAFDNLKSAMSQASLLTLPDFSKKFVIETGAF
jgi:hypothetical protein